MGTTTCEYAVRRPVAFVADGFWRAERIQQCCGRRSPTQSTRTRTHLNDLLPERTYTDTGTARVVVIIRENQARNAVHIWDGTERADFYAKTLCQLSASKMM